METDGMGLIFKQLNGWFLAGIGLNSLMVDSYQVDATPWSQSRDMSTTVSEQFLENFFTHIQQHTKFTQIAQSIQIFEFIH